MRDIVLGSTYRRDRLRDRPGGRLDSAELEARLVPVYERCTLSPGQLEALDRDRRAAVVGEGYRLSDGAVAAARKALDAADVRPDEIDALIYAGVCRE